MMMQKYVNKTLNYLQGNCQAGSTHRPLCAYIQCRLEFDMAPMSASNGPKSFRFQLVFWCGMIHNFFGSFTSIRVSTRFVLALNANSAVTFIFCRVNEQVLLCIQTKKFLSLTSDYLLMMMLRSFSIPLLNCFSSAQF